MSFISQIIFPRAELVSRIAISPNNFNFEIRVRCCKDIILPEISKELFSLPNCPCTFEMFTFFHRKLCHNNFHKETPLNPRSRAIPLTSHHQVNNKKLVSVRRRICSVTMLATTCRKNSTEHLII